MVQPSDLQKLVVAIQGLTECLDKRHEEHNTLRFQTSQLGETVLKLHQHQRFMDDENSSNNRRNSKTTKEDDIMLNELLEFDGDDDADTYLNWESRIEIIFDHKKASDAKRFSFAILKFTKYASLRYEMMQSQRRQDGKQKIDSWEDSKTKMRKRFIP